MGLLPVVRNSVDVIKLHNFHKFSYQYDFQMKVSQVDS